MGAKVILVAGPPGSGKTTLVDQLLTRLPAARAIRYGELLFERFGRANGIESYDEFRRQARRLVSTSDVRDIDETVVSMVKSWDDTVTALIEIHTVVLKDNGFLANPYTPDRLRDLRLRGVLFLKRIGLRKEIAVPDDQPGILEHLLLLQEMMAIGYSAVTGAPLYILEVGSLESGAVAEAALGFVQSV